MRALKIDFGLPHESAARTWARRWLHAPRSGWVLLVVGALLFAGLTARYLAADAAREAQQRHRSELMERENAAREAERARQPIPVPPYTDDRRWQRAATELARPWVPTLESIEVTSRAPVYLLALRTDPAAGRIQIEAEAPRFEDALAYLAPLQQLPGFTQTQLVSHESTQDPGGRAFVRFAVQTQWVAP